MACLPGMPCYGPLVKVVYPPGCDPYANRITQSSFVEYDGENLSCTGIQTCDTLTVALQKIDNKICSSEFVAQIIQTIANDDVLLAYFCQLVAECGPITTTTTSTTATPTTTTTSSSTSTSTSTTTTTTTGYVQNAILGIDEGTLAPYNSLEDACGDSAPVELYSYTFPNRQSVNVGVTLYVLPLYDPISQPGWYRYWYTTTNNVSTPINPPQYIYIDETGTVTDISECPGTTTTTTTNCLTGFTQIAFSTYIQNTETSEYTFFDEGTVEDACAALALYLGGGYSIGGFDAYISAFEIGGTAKTSICTPVPNGTYINSSFGNNVFTVSGGIITDIVDCTSTTTTTTTIP